GPQISPWVGRLGCRLGEPAVSRRAGPASSRRGRGCRRPGAARLTLSVENRGVGRAAGAHRDPGLGRARRRRGVWRTPTCRGGTEVGEWPLVPGVAWSSTNEGSRGGTLARLLPLT
ncbi:unnamed protein product, partial [Laminaria digitata]